MKDNRTERLRRSAAECLELAQTTSDDRAKRTLLCLAQVWTNLMQQRFVANKVEGLVDMLDTTAVPREAMTLVSAD